MNDDRMIVLYDGVCALCNRVTQFVLPRDRKDRFRFAAIQGDFGQKTLAAHHQPLDVLDTFYLVVDPGLPTERLVTRGRAALTLLTAIGGLWTLFGLFRLLPDPLINALYGVVARNRYHWFGKLDACALPRPEWKHKFL
jgi:predicted DCC family thiol-disulfide oxidoreductase YuxK